LEENYYRSDREELLEFLVQNSQLHGRVLDVGCGEGQLGAHIRAHGAAEVWGVEPVHEAAVRASEHLTHVYEGFFPGVSIDSDVRFDLIVFADSLEHMTDPWEALREARGLVSPTGRVLISVPNVAHYSVIQKQLRGRWDYADSGLLDRTHLRFFTPKTIVEAVVESGYRVVAAGAKDVPPPSKKYRPAVWLMRRFTPDMLVYQQYLLIEPAVAR